MWVICSGLCHHTIYDECVIQPVKLATTISYAPEK